MEDNNITLCVIIDLQIKAHCVSWARFESSFLSDNQFSFLRARDRHSIGGDVSFENSSFLWYISACQSLFRWRKFILHEMALLDSIVFPFGNYQFKKEKWQSLRVPWFESELCVWICSIVLHTFFHRYSWCDYLCNCMNYSHVFSSQIQKDRLSN